MKHSLITIGFLSIILLGCSALSDDELEVILVAPDGESHTVYVEVADTEPERQQGLMNRESLEPDTGMFFIFDQIKTRTFWMKNTLIPLDIMYFDEDGILVSLATMEPCTEDPCRHYSSQVPVKYALEVAAGYIDEFGVEEGWKLLR